MVERNNQMVERHNNMAQNRAERQAMMGDMMDEACETGELPEDLESPRADWMEENLDAVCQLHEARQSGDYDAEELKELAESLGIEMPQYRMGGMQGHGRHGGKGFFHQVEE